MAGEKYRQNSQGRGHVSAAVARLYNPDHAQMLPITIPESLHICGWLDDEHLLLLRPPPSVGYKQTNIPYHIATGADAEIPRTSP